MQNVATLMVATIVTVAQVTRIVLQGDLKPSIASVSGFVYSKERYLILFHVIMQLLNWAEYWNLQQFFQTSTSVTRWQAPVVRTLPVRIWLETPRTHVRVYQAVNSSLPGMLTQLDVLVRSDRRGKIKWNYKNTIVDRVGRWIHLKYKGISVPCYRPHPKYGEGTVFTDMWLSTEGYPSSRFFPRSLVPGPFLGGYPVPGSFPGLWSQVLSQRVTQSQVLSQVSGPRSWLGGTPVPVGGEVSQSQLGRVPQDRGTPKARTGLRYSQAGLRSQLLRQNSRASTCYVAGGMPLAVTQEDFLVHSDWSLPCQVTHFIWMFQVKHTIDISFGYFRRRWMCI